MQTILSAASLVRLLALSIGVISAGACTCGSSSSSAAVLEIKDGAGAVRALSLKDLEAMPQHEAALKGHTCQGVRLRELFGGSASGVVARGSDGYTQTLNASTTARDDVIVAAQCDGKPLTEKEGPLRIVVPDSPGLSVFKLKQLEAEAHP